MERETDGTVSRFCVRGNPNSHFGRDKIQKSLFRPAKNGAFMQIDL
jgi:hypothetical protein